MKIRFKPLLVVAVMSVALSACGGGSSSGTQEEQLASVDLLPVPQEQKPQEQSEEPAGNTVPDEATTTPKEPEPQDQAEAPLPIANQTGWSMNGLETRKPLELLKTVMCVARADMGAVPTPASSADCSVAFPELISNGTLRFEGLSVPEGTVFVEREGCAYVPDAQVLVCSWQFTMPNSSTSSGVSNHWMSIPFMPSFSVDIESCEAGKDHLFPMQYGRGGAASGPTVKAPSLPQGCVGWEEVTYFVEHSEYHLNSDVVQD
jgi:hypothetical protein